jgi:hypothetical protein
MARDEEQGLLRARQDTRTRIDQIDNQIFALRIGEIESPVPRVPSIWRGSHPC